jgi:hypothetical protein
MAKPITLTRLDARWTRTIERSRLVLQTERRLSTQPVAPAEDVKQIALPIETGASRRLSFYFDKTDVMETCAGASSAAISLDESGMGQVFDLQHRFWPISMRCTNEGFAILWSTTTLPGRTATGGTCDAIAALKHANLQSSSSELRRIAKDPSCRAG